MAVTTSAMPSSMTDAYNADKPIILSKNLLETGIGLSMPFGPETMSACWRSTSHSGGATPIAISQFPRNSDAWQSPTNAFNRQIGSYTAPLIAPADTSDGYFKHCFIARIAVNEAPNSIDTMIIGSHNFSEIDPGLSAYPLKVTTYFSDVADFSSYVLGEQWDITNTYYGTRRLVDFRSSFYYGVQYIQIVVSLPATSPVKLAAPQIGEVFVGPRRQLSRNPDQESFDTDTTENVIGSFSSRSGITTRYSVSRGRAVRSPKFYPSGDAVQGTTDLYGLNDLDTFELFWADISYGAKPFFYIPHPKTLETNAYFMHSEKTEFPSTILGGLTERELEYEFREVSPYLSSES